MRLVLGTNQLGLGGSESYLLTVAEQFDRLGHEVVVYAPEGGPGIAAALERSLTVADEVGLPPDCDAALVQDAAVCAQLAERYPSAPQLFVAHSEYFDLQAPPQLDGLVDVVVALNERVEERMRSFGVEVEVVRLSQPIDTERFVSRNPLPEAPRRALLFSNTPISDRLRTLEAACEASEIELVRLGGIDGQTTDPRSAINDADIVIGYGRSILEGMACGRAAYVYDWNGGDGWITPGSYAAIEAGGFAGRSSGESFDAGRVEADLRAYSAAMGPVNHDLVIANHRANVHAQRLVELIRGLGAAGDRPRAPLQEMARLVRLEWRARAEVHALSRENVSLRDMLEESRERAHEEKLEYAATMVANQRRSYESSASWRFTAPLRYLTRKLRRSRR